MKLSIGSIVKCPFCETNFSTNENENYGSTCPFCGHTFMFPDEIVEEKHSQWTWAVLLWLILVGIVICYSMIR